MKGIRSVQIFSALAIDTLARARAGAALKRISENFPLLIFHYLPIIPTIAGPFEFRYVCQELKPITRLTLDIHQGSGDLSPMKMKAQKDQNP